MSRLETPVALFVFNRPSHTRRVLETIALARPSCLLLVADGPRANRDGDAQRCDEVRKIISAVDWPCRVETNFSNENLGCRRRLISGLNWVFSLVEEAIILEDDCVPDQSFFPYCAELLHRYRNCEQIGLISGYNPVPEEFPFRFSYCFTKMVLIWGWASWRRTWEKYDEHINTWPSVRNDVLRDLWPDPEHRSYWATIFENMYQGIGPDTWDYQLVFMSWARHLLNIIPQQNLIRNVGSGTDATHTKKDAIAFSIPTGHLSFPLSHAPEIAEWVDHPQLLQSRIYSPDLLRRVQQAALLKMRRLTRAR